MAGYSRRTIWMGQNGIAIEKRHKQQQNMRYLYRRRDIVCIVSMGNILLQHIHKKTFHNFFVFSCFCIFFVCCSVSNLFFVYFFFGGIFEWPFRIVVAIETLVAFCPYPQLNVLCIHFSCLSTLFSFDKTVNWSHEHIPYLYKQMKTERKGIS